MVDLFDFQNNIEQENKEDGRFIYSVSQINTEIKTILEDSYPSVWVCGEISGFNHSSAGHMYFTLKDEKSQIAAVMFSFKNKNLKFELKDGMQVLVYGKITTYTNRSIYQIQVYHVEEKGIGSLQKKFEQLKDSLLKEGLFDESHKKQIPYLVNKIGVVTSKDGAALHDILSVLNRRFSNVEVLIYPVLVQGEQAKFEISEAIQYLNENHKELDVLLVGRGGGSLEDLWAFNEEIVARAIYNSKIPIISCVGHEVDYTIADFVADLRAATPSVAAELVVKNRTDIEEKIQMYKNSLLTKIENIIDVYEEKLNYFKNSRALSKPYEIYEDKIRYIDNFRKNIIIQIKHIIDVYEQKILFFKNSRALSKPYEIYEDKINNIESLKKRIINQMKNIIRFYEEKINKFKESRVLSRPNEIYEEKTQYLDELREHLSSQINNLLQNKQKDLRLNINKLDLLSPLKVLKRGYSVCFDSKGKVVKKVEQVIKEDIIDIKLSDGTIKTKVI